MREIKFRAWNKVLKIFAPDSANITIQGDDAGVYLDTFNGNFGSDWWRLKDCEIIQYIGIKDKNGREIHEGHILDGIYQGVFVHWCEKCKSFNLAFKDYRCAACSIDLWWREFVEKADDFEIIGNIYENPELLEL